MRRWYKYSLDPSRSGTLELPIDQEAEEHARTMGGYEADEAYQSKDEFFRRYFFGYQLGRLECYDTVLRRHLSQADDVLSLGSGRCANELLLMEDGYDRITCSDLAAREIYDRTTALFPVFRYRRLNILEAPSSQLHDAVICLSLAYLFDDGQLRTFFRHASGSLKPGGQLIVDYPGSPDHLASYFLYEVVLKGETACLRLAKRLLTHRWEGWVKKHHGYRRTDREILEAARPAGLSLRHRYRDAFTVEFRRSRLLNRLISSHALVERACGLAGRVFPYVRMFVFEKTSTDAADGG